MKFKIREFSIQYAKKVAKQKRDKFDSLEKSISQFENNPEANNPISFETYMANKLEFETLMEENTNGHIIRSKVEWYEKGEKSSKFFLSLEKKKGVQNTIKVVANENDLSESGDNNTVENITSPNAIKNEIKKFYMQLFERKSDMSVEQCLQFLSDINLPCITSTQN